ncbi:MAG: hypothetical protein ABR498_02140 [Candidatus Dormibacteria bacterium]
MSERARVLVAADAPMVVTILAHKLRREGHDVTTARGSDEFARAVAGASFDVAVCELALAAGLRDDGTSDRESRVRPPLGAAALSRRPARSDDVRAGSEKLSLVTCRPLADLGNWLAIVDGRDDAAAVRAMHRGAAGVVRTPFKPTAVAEQVATLLRIAVTA